MAEVQLNPNPQNEGLTVDLGAQGLTVPSSQTASHQASKASFGLGELTGMPYDEIYSKISNGQEDQFRQEAASSADVNKAKRKQAAVTQAVQLGMPDKQLAQIIGIPTGTDPKSVTEEYHAAKYFQPMWDHPDEDVAKDVDAAYKAINAGVSNLTYKNYAVTRLQKALDSYKNESWLDWSADQLKNLSQIYTEYKLRGGFSGDWSGLLGTSLSKEITQSYQMPLEDYKKWVDTRADELEKDNPALAVTFLSAVVGQSDNDIRESNLTTLVGVPSDVATIGGVAIDTLSAINRIRAAVQSVVKSTNIIDPNLAKILDEAGGKGSASTMKDVTPQDIKAAQATGHGDPAEAAIQDITQDIKAKFEKKESADQESIKSLPTLWKPEAGQGHGSSGGDIYNRIKEQADRRQIDFNKGVSDLIRVNRTPVVVASEDLARAIHTEIKNKYAGPNSTIADTTGTQLVLHIPSNTYHVNIDIVNHDGEYFANAAEAISHAEAYRIGLQEPATTTRQYWDDEATAAAFEVEHIRKQLDKYARYSKHQFKPKAFYELQRRLKEQNQRKKMAWANRAGAYWRPNLPIEAKLGKTILEKQGKGWFIQGWVPLDETQSFIRDALLKMPNAWSGPARVAKRQGTLTPYLEDYVTGTPSKRLWATVMINLDSFFGGKGGGVLQGIRTPEETLSPQENIQRKIAVHTPSKLMDILFGEDVKTLNKVKGKSKAALRRILVANQTMPDPVTGQSGYFFRNIDEFESYFNNFIGRFPTEDEIAGYFAYTGMYETDRGLRTLATLRNKWRAGVESIQIEVGHNRQESKWFDAVKRTELPTAFEKAPVFIAVDSEPHYVKASGAYTKALAEGVKEGKYQVWELWNREDRPFHEFGRIPEDTEPRFVISDRVMSRPINPNDQIPKRGGGHWVFPYDHYVRQAKTYFDPVTKQWVYKGDVTFMPFQNKALGQKTVSFFNEIRSLIREGLIDEARDYVKYKGIAGLNFDKDILPWFKGPNARFNLHEPFRLTPTDKTIMSLDNDLLNRYESLGGIEDTTRRGNMARNSIVEFTGERDAWDMHTIEDSGTARNPVWTYRPAQLADPIDVISRAITRIANSMWLDDYKYFAAEHWYQTYKNYLNIDKGGSPFYHFINPEWKTGVDKDNPAVIKLAMSSRKKSMDLVRMESPLGNMYHQVMADAAGAIYNLAGPKAYNYFQPIASLGSEHNPVRFLRSVMADLKIGLWSIPASFMQLSAFSNIIGFEPRHVAAGTRATMFDEWLRVNPEHVDFLDKMASKINLRGYGRIPLSAATSQVGAVILPGGGKGLVEQALTQSYWRPGHFKHAWTNLQTRTDFGRVGAEHAHLGKDFALTDRYMRTKAQLARYWGQVFFRESAQFVRRAGFYTSYLKWAEEHDWRFPQTRDEWAEIIAYATDLDHNMSRASNSAINTGFPMGVMTQFMTYDRNLAEDMWGKRFTPWQKARVMFVNGLMWGIPYGAFGLLGLPAGYLAYKLAVENGYVPGDNTLVSTAIEGLPAYQLAKLTGHGNPHAGIWEDFSRFGVKGWGMVAGFFSDDPKWWKIFGALPSGIVETLTRTKPLQRDFINLVKGENTFTAEDWADLLKEASSFSHFHRAYMWHKYGVWLSNNNTPMKGDATASQIILNTLTGMSPSDISEIGPDFGILGDRKEAEQMLIREGARNLYLSLLEAKNNPDLDNNKSYLAYRRKLEIILNMAGPARRDHVLKAIVNRTKQPLVEALEKEMSSTGSTGDLERYRKQLELNRLRQGK